MQSAASGRLPTAYDATEKNMEFEAYADARLAQVTEQEHDANRVNELAYLYIDEIFSCDAGAYSVFRNFRLERGEGFQIRLTAHESVLEGCLEHVRIGDSFGGRWVFRRAERDGEGRTVQVPIFSIEFDREARLRYGTKGPWAERIERNPKAPWKSRDRLIANLVAAIQDRLDRAAA
jgi:hypothetical protein